MEAGSVLKPVLTCAPIPFLNLLSLTKGFEVADVGNSDDAEPNPREVFPPADNSLLFDFEFRTNNFLGRSTPKKDQLLKPEPTLGNNAESSSLHLSSVATHIEGWEPVPSSRSPSPMVMITKSPSKEVEREERAHQVIAESIATLLGKRQASKEEVTATAQNGRVTKRSRPLSRNKVRSLTLFSEGKIDQAPTVLEQGEGVGR